MIVSQPSQLQSQNWAYIETLTDVPGDVFPDFADQGWKPCEEFKAIADARMRRIANEATRRVIRVLKSAKARATTPNA